MNYIFFNTIQFWFFIARTNINYLSLEYANGKEVEIPRKFYHFSSWIFPSMHLGRQAMCEEAMARTPRKLASQQWVGSRSSDITHKNTSIMRSLRTCGCVLVCECAAASCSLLMTVKLSVCVCACPCRWQEFRPESTLEFSHFAAAPRRARFE